MRCYALDALGSIEPGVPFVAANATESIGR